LRLLRDPRDASLARNFLSHPNWRIRVRSVTALERVGDADDVQRLECALSDVEWWVRMRAARTLIRLPFVSDGQLRRLLTSLDNHSASDALMQVMRDEARQ
jgi:hypothetical protein